jgi:uncharacterized protein
MKFVIWFEGNPDTDKIRAGNRADHLRFVIERREMLVFGGACLDDAQSAMAGMLMVIEASDRHEAEAFVAAEPYSRVGAFSKVSIMPFGVRIPEPSEGFLEAELAATEAVQYS